VKVKVNENNYNIEIIGQKVSVNGRQISVVLNENEITIGRKKFHLDYIDDAEPALMIVNGMTYIVSKSSEPTESTKHLKAPISGRIVDVLVKVGDNIKKGQTVLVLESMKMESHINSPTTAKISELMVQIGQSVKSGEVLVTFV
jgi:biotin carboxyl carrier protein